jgi:hypothetical protein
MLKWLTSLFKVPEPAGPAQTIRTFRTSDPTITQGGITVDEGGWLIDSTEKQTIRLFEVQNPEVEQCMVTYKAQLKTENLQGRAYLEMWCRFPGRGEFFSKGFQHAVKGTTLWSSYEIPFYLKKGQKPDLIKLNLAVEGVGKVWIKDIELLKTTLSS